MLFIGPINKNSNYRVVKTNNKIMPVNGISKMDNSRSNNNSSDFSKYLEEEIQKIKCKKNK